MATQSIPRITEEEYLRLERPAESKSEFIGGEIFPMPGGTIRHSLLAIKFSSALDRRSLQRDFYVLSSDARIRTPVTGSFIYPDVAVVSGKPETYKSGGDNLLNPVVVVEVLSPSTADYDHGKKFELYREIPSLTDYLLAHTDAPWVEQFTRQPDGSWSFREHRGLENALTIASLDCTLPFAELYERVFEVPE